MKLMLPADQNMVFISVTLILLSLYLPQIAPADLSSDEEALLKFAALVPHGRKLNWSSQTPICSSWVGVTCTPYAKRVRTLRLPAIGLLGSIPADTLGKLDALKVLSLRSNRLTGDLPADVLSIPSLHSLYLQHNNLSGIIPSSLSSSLTFLDLSHNLLTGEIPLTTQKLARLTSLFLQYNSLSGPILNLQLPGLRHLNLSYNNLSGSIPLSLQKFPIESFLGNPSLCGASLSPCPEHPPKHKRNFWKKLSTGVIVAIVAGFALLLLLIILILVYFFKRRRRQGSRESNGKTHGGRSQKPEEYSSSIQEAEKNKLVFFDGCSYNFDLEDLLRASAEILGKGSHGTTYKALLEDGTTVVVKRLKEVIIGKREFEQQMEMIGRVRAHPNVVPLRAYYYSKDEKLLINDDFPSGNFSCLLHGTKNAEKAPLDWDSRVKISLGSARGIAHIHSEGGGKFIHGNIKSNNILLTQQLDACVTDYGLAPLMTSAATPSRIVVGYRAPEVIESRKYSQKSDVYSFGVLLLEMLTGKAPLRTPGRDDVVDLPRWVQSVVREEWTAEVFDLQLMKFPQIEGELVEMLQIAMSCVSRAPDQRPTMEAVVRMMEGVRHSDSGNRPSSENAQTPEAETQGTAVTQ